MKAVTGEPERMIEKNFSLKASSCELAGARSQLRALLQQSGCDEKVSGEVILAVDERLSNIIRHGYCGKQGEIEVAFRAAEGLIHISIKDFSPKFNPLNQPEPKLPRETPGGLGIFLTRELMDETVYDESFTEGNLLHLTKHLKKR